MNFLIDTIKNTLEWVIRDIVWNAVMGIWNFVSSRFVKHPVIGAIVFLAFSLIVGYFWMF